MPFRGIDTSPLFQQPGPSPIQQGMAGIGSVLDTIMQRRHQMDLQKQQQEAQAAQAKADREAQQGHWNQIDARERDRYAAEDKRHAQKVRAEMAKDLAEDYAKNQGRGAGLIAGGYGGKLEDVTAPGTMPTDSPDFGDESLSSQPAPVKTGRVRISGLGDPLEFAPPQAGPAGDHYARLRAQVMMFPRSPAREAELRRINEAEALGLDPKGTIGHVEDERQRRQGERNAYINAGIQSRRATETAAIADRRADEKEQDAARKKLGALSDKAGNADRDLALMDEIVQRNGGVPAAGPDRDLYDQAMKRASGSIALVESGNPESEASDPTKRSIQERIGTTRLGAAVSSLPLVGPLIGSGGQERAAQKIKGEREALKARLQERARALGVEAPGEAASVDRLEAWKRKRGAQ